MTREEFEGQLEARGFVRVDADTWKMAEQPPKPWARVGARVRGDRYDSLIFFEGGGVGVVEKGLRFDQTRALFSVPSEGDSAVEVSEDARTRVRVTMEQFREWRDELMTAEEYEGFLRAMVSAIGDELKG
jgi:hypothetical protein